VVCLKGMLLCLVLHHDQLKHATQHGIAQHVTAEQRSTEI
jgi:hypothetical protein